MTGTAAVIIPALNEATTIGAVVREVRESFSGDIVVVDNGSTDETARVAAEAGARVVLEPTPGYGRACMAGVTAASDATTLVFMDGDGSDIPASIPTLLEAIEAGADLALGVRRGAAVEPGSMTSAARFGNALSGAALAVRYGRRLHDLSPLKAVRRPHLERIAPRELTYGWTVEVLARSLELGARIEEVEVGYRHRAGGQSKVSGDLRGASRAAVRILATIARVSLIPRSAPARGGAIGAGVAVACLVAFALWLASIEAATIRAGVAVWLVAWPTVLLGTGLGMLIGASSRLGSRRRAR